MIIGLKKNVYPFLDYLIVFFAVMRNYSMLSRDQAYGIPAQVLDIFLLSILIAYFFLHIFSGRVKLPKRKVVLILIVLITSFCSVALHRDGVFGGIIFFVFPITMSALYFAFKDSPEDFWIKFTNIIFVMATVSLILYFLGSVFKIIPPTRTAYFLYDGEIKACNTYFGLQYEAQGAQIRISDAFRYRNCGFFIEAPMYNILLCFAFAAECAFQEKVRKKVLAVLAVTIVTTMTTTGIIFLIAMVTVYIFTRGRGDRIKALRLTIIPAIGLVFAFLLFSLMESKMQSSSGSKSVGVRMDHMMAFFKIFLEYPLFGIGYGNTDIFFEYSSYEYSYSVGLPALLGRCGIFFFLVYMIPWLNNILYSFKKEKKQLYFWVGTFICLFLTAVVFQPIMYLTIAFQLMMNSTKYKKRDLI